MTGSPEPDGGGTPVFGGVSDAELEVFVGQLRTDKNPRAPAATASSRARGDVHGDRLHKGVRRSLVSSVLAEEAPAQARPPEEKHAWFVVLGAGSVGPLDAQALKGYWERGELGPESLCWRVGFAAWLPLGQVPELIETFAPLPTELSDAVDAALSALAEGPDLSPMVPMATGSAAPALIAAASSVSLPVDPVGAHAVLAEVTAASEQVEARWRLSGWWYTLAGGVAGGVTVALVMGLMGGWSGISAALSRKKDVAPVAANPPPPVAPVVVSPPPVVPAPVTPAPVAATSPAAVVPVEATAPAVEKSAVAAGGGASPAVTSPARPSLTGVATVERGGALPVLSTSGGSLGTSLVGTSSTSRVARDVESAPAAAIAPRVTEVKLGSSKKPAAPPAPTMAPSNAVPAPPASDDDLGLDEDFDRELSGPVAGSGKREAPRNVYVPPVAPIQNPRVTLTQSDVFEVVLAKKAEVTACANTKPRPVDEGTRVVVRWTILPSGEVDEVVTETASLKGTAFARCVEGRVRAWVFPKHQEQGGAVRFPFVF
ncbi:AgmX/PglI C-terminal domain-containing protein [Myxococcus stipitatus]|uniref:AgmX/PglI C-terminal domain-containing protein n=1 Tax=Myxococcus stipitatus TaxID=83455 RepID=UPI0031450458